MAEGDSFIRYSDFIVPDDSVEKLIGLLEEVNNHMTKVAASVPVTAEKMTAAIKKVTGVTTDGENALAEMAEFIEKLEKAYRDLAYAQSDFGKTAAVVKEQIKETNNETVSQYKLNKTLSGSIDRLNEALKREMALYEALSSAERTMGSAGAESLATIRKLTEERAFAQRGLKASVGAVNDYVRAQVNLAKQDDEFAQTTAYVNEMYAQRRKELKLHAAVMKTTAGSINNVKARLDELTAKYKALGDLSTPEALQKKSEILELTAQYNELTASMNGSSLSSDALANASRKLALSQSEEATTIAEMNAQAEINKFNTEAGLKLDVELEKAEKKLQLAQTDRAQTLARTNQEIKEQNDLNEINAALQRANIPLETEARNAVDLTRVSYNGLQAMYAANVVELKKLSISEVDQRNELEAMQKQIASLMVTMDQGINAGHGSLSRLSKNFDGLSFSISQLLREAPAAAVSMNTFFLAISNNIPMLVDQIQRARQEVKLLREAGNQTEGVWKRIGKSLLSFNTIVVALVTVLTLFGDKIVNWVKNLITGNRTLVSYNKLLKNVTKQMKEASDSYADGLVTLNKLRLEWQNLTNDTQRTKWIKNNKTEFTKLGVAVETVADAENVLVKNTAKVIEAMRLRAMAAATEEVAAEQYKKSIEEGITQATIRESYTAKRQADAAAMLGAGANPETVAQWEAEQAAADEKALETNKKMEASKKRQAGYDQNAANALKIGLDYTQRYFDELKKAGIKPEDLFGGKAAGAGEGRGRSIEEYIRNMSVSLIKKANDAAADAIEDGFAKRKAQIEAKAANELAELQKTYDKNDDILNRRGIYAKAKVTPEQEAQLRAANESMSAIIIDIQTALNRDLEKLEHEHNIQMARLEQERYNRILAFGNQTAEAELATRKTILEAERKAELEDYRLRNQDDRIRNVQGEDIGEALINREYDKKQEDLELQHQIELNRIKLDGINTRLEMVQAGSDDELDLLLKKLEVEKQIALAENKLKPKSEQQSEADITGSFSVKAAQTTGAAQLTRFEESQDLKRAQFEGEAITRPKTTVQVTRFELEQERDMWDKKVKLAEAGMLKWSNTQIETAKQTVKNLEDELAKLPTGINEALAAIGEYGPGGALLHLMGLDEDQISMFQSATETVIGFINDILDAQIEAAEQEIELAQKRVDAAKEALDAEIEARNNGYANQVLQARNELDLQKQQQNKALEEKKKAQAAQLALDSVTQASSLVTASAEIWAALGGITPIGPALAAAAVIAMWGSFAASKIKALQVTNQAQLYGDGGLEILEGGSHASGNDIDLGVNNRRHRRMRAEGGEALAIISKKRTRQYRDILPGLINSLNNGTFEKSYTRAFDIPVGLQIAGMGQTTDVSRLEQDVAKIKEELGYKRYTEGNRTIIKNGNLTQVIVH